MKKYHAAALAFGALLLTVLPGAAAHKPLDSNNNESFDAATVIPEHSVSWAIYQELQGENTADFYRFEGRQGERFYMQLTIPDLEQYDDFVPKIALIGSGLNGAVIESGENTEEERLHEETGLSVPVSGDAMVFDYKSAGPVAIFFEPFTQTSYNIHQELVIDSLPATDNYTIVVFDDALRQSESGKYVLAVGEREEFSVIDYFTTLPAAWFETKLFFEDYASIAIAVAAVIGSIGLLMIAIFRNRIREKLRAR